MDNNSFEIEWKWKIRLFWENIKYVPFVERCVIPIWQHSKQNHWAIWLKAWTSISFTSKMVIEHFIYLKGKNMDIVAQIQHPEIDLFITRQTNLRSYKHKHFKSLRSLARWWCCLYCIRAISPVYWKVSAFAFHCKCGFESYCF